MHVSSEDKWSIIFDYLSDVIMVMNSDCKILFANKAAAEFLNLPTEAIIGSFCFKLIHGTEAPVAGCPMVAMLKNRSCTKSEEADLYLDNRGFWARVTTYPPLSGEKDKDRIVHIIRNIDSGKRIEEALRKRVRELNCLYEFSALMEAKGGSVEEIFEGTLKLIASACQYPEIAAAKLVWTNKEFLSENWKETEWMLRQDIAARGIPVGFVQLAYLTERPDHAKEPFLPEEKELLFAIAERLGRVIERNLSDAALKENEEKYRIHFENISDICFSLDNRLRIDNISPSVERVLGYKPEELIGKRFVDANILAPESQQRAVANAMRVLAGDRTESSAYQFIAKNGSAVMGEINSSPLRLNGKIIGMVSVARDTTKRHETEHKLKRINALLSTQQDTSPDGILVILEIWNVSPERMTSSNRMQALQDAAGKTVDSEGFLALIRHLYEHGHEKSQDEILLKDGRVLERYSVPMIGDDNRHYGRVWYFRDITQRRQTEEKMIQANEKLVATINQLEERNYYNNVLSEMSEMLQACSLASEAPAIIRGSMRKLFPHAEGALFMMNATKSDLEAAIRWDDFPVDVDEDIFAPDACWALRRGRAHLVEDVSIGPICPHLKLRPATAHVCLPLVAKGEVLGMLHLRVKRTADPDMQHKTISGMKELASTVTEYLSLSIASIQLSERLADQSIRDPLTGLFNRRYMVESLQREILRADRKKTSIGIIMADIDRFKQFNDRYGHAAGDELLARLGDYFRANVRGGDVACRYGGEEFILILPESSMLHTCKRAEEIRIKVQALEVRYQGESLSSATLSFGIATYPDQGTQAEALLRAADAALYKAKEGGRNRIAVSQASVA
jgi:diguanylate cyclase (GGDEF)-like protein/PAS domain S-box-containing protein